MPSAVAFAARIGSTDSVNRNRFIVALLALAASMAGVLNDFVYDDVPLIRDNVRVHGVSHWGEIFTSPYWPPPFVEQLYRPFTLALLSVEHAIGGGSPLMVRLVSYALYAACAVLVYGLYARLLSQEAALAAAALFAVHPVHVEAVALGVGQGELIVGLCAVLMVSRYIDRRRSGGLSAGDWATLAALYMVATLSKENGFVLPGLLIAAEVLNDGTWDKTRKPWAGYVVLVAVGAAMLLLRHVVLHGDTLHVVTTHTLAGLGAGGRMVAMLQVAPMWLERFLWPAHLEVDYAPGLVFQPVRVALGVALSLGVLTLLAISRRRAPILCFGLIWCLIGLLPVSNIVPTGVVLAERTLFLPSIGVLLAVGASGELLLKKWPSADVRHFIVTLSMALTLLGIIRSASRHHVWNSSHLVVKRAPAS